jgi:predicted DNA-binding ribbon-helix-helix protein
MNTEAGIQPSLTHHAVRKHSVRLFGHLTSISLEEPFWQELHRLADQHGLSLTRLIEQIDEARTAEMVDGPGNLSSALRLYVLGEIMAERDAARQEREA